jgi:hypothetical protein
VSGRDCSEWWPTRVNESQRESTRGRRGSPFLVMERRPFEVNSPENWPIRTLFPALIAKLNSVSEGENRCSISSLERICVPDDEQTGSNESTAPAGSPLHEALVLVPCLTAQKPEPAEKHKRSAQEEGIREAAFLYLFEVGTGPDPDYSFFCLSVDSDGFKDQHDPSDALMKRFPRMHRTLRKFSSRRKTKGLI